MRMGMNRYVSSVNCRHSIKAKRLLGKTIADRASLSWEIVDFKLQNEDVGR